MHGRHLLKAYSSTQHVISLSSGESEFYAGVKASSALLGAKALTEDYGLEMECELCLDATAAKAMLARRGHGKAKHIARSFLWVQQRLTQRAFSLRKVGTDENPADAGTKYLDGPRLQYLCERCGLRFSDKRHERALRA